jgi:hypothetical protein
MQWRLNEILTAATIVTGSMAAISYAFSTAYIYTLEPHFLSAFSIADLVFLFASSLSLFITTVLVLSPVVVGALWLHYARDTKTLAGPLFSEDADQASSEQNSIPPSTLMYGIGFAVLILCGAINIALLGVISFNLPGELQVGPLDNVGNLVGLAALIAVTGRPRQFLPLSLPLALVVCLVTAYSAGDMMGRWDVSADPNSRKLPCVFVNKGKECLDVLVLGSEAIVIRRERRVLLIPREQATLIASRQDHYQVEAK